MTGAFSDDIILAIGLRNLFLKGTAKIAVCYAKNFPSRSFRLSQIINLNNNCSRHKHLRWQDQNDIKEE